MKSMCACLIVLSSGVAWSSVATPFSPHMHDAQRHAEAAVHPGHHRGPLADKSVAASGPTSVPCQTIFGYLPYWEDPTPLRWDLLTHLACFSVEVNETGAVTNRRGWPWTSTINMAKANGVKVILVVALFDGPKIETLITTPSYKQRFFQNMRDLMLEGDADGLNVDFESGTTWQQHFPAFLTELNAYLEQYIPDVELTVAAPPVNWGNHWDLAAVADACDGIFIMGYAFAGGWSSSTGANAPLTGGSINMTNTVDVQYAGVPRDKLILGVPYYGHHWRTGSDSANAWVASFVSSTRFFNDQPNSGFYGRLWDSASQTPWYRWFSNGQWNQVWYDDAESLALKYQLAVDRGLSGVGMWALGYDEGRDELWDVLDSMFGGCGQLLDFNDDRLVNFDDVRIMEFCMAGPDANFVPGNMCLRPDLDDDFDVDLRDVSETQRGWGD